MKFRFESLPPVGKPKAVSLELSSASPPIDIQLNDQSLRVRDPKAVSEWQKGADALTVLGAIELLSASAIDEARNKLLSIISESVYPVDRDRTPSAIAEKVRLIAQA